MAKELSLSDLEPAIEIFKAANIQAVQKVVQRAEKRALAAGKGQHQRMKSAMPPGKGARALKGALGKAMDSHGRQAKGRPSIRLTAPDTGGRLYHFGYTVVTKGQRKATTSSARRAGAAEAEAGGGAAGARGKGGPGATGGRKTAGTGKRHRANTREGAHQMYTERDAAVEEGQALDERPREGMAFMDGAGAPGVGPDGKDAAGRSMEAEQSVEAGGPEASGRAERVPGAGREESQAWVEEGMALSPGLSERHGEAAAQAYIEDAAKLPKLRGHTASFGTIGDTIEERLRFWDLVHEHESDKGGRTQSRLVLELPHEASAQERHEIVRRYTDDMFRSKGMPYWASIHAPTKENDDRNHHAHVVFSDRPAKRMVDPETGKEEWDFAIAVTKKKASRNTVVTHPHRQNRSDDTRDRGWVKRARSRFPEVTNDVMVGAGKGVRYDPRSYKDMGLEAAPMRNVRRIVTDKAKGQTFVVMDAEWTRRMVDQEMRDAAIRRSATFQAMVRTEGLLEEASRNAAAAEKAQARLPAHLRMGVPTRLGSALARKVTTAVLEGERERLARRFVEEATERTLRNVMEATRPAPKAKAAGKVHDAGNAPDAEALAELHAAAREELAAHRKSSTLAASAAGRRMARLRGPWGAERSTTPATTPTTAGADTRAGAAGKSSAQAGTARASEEASRTSAPASTVQEADRAPMPRGTARSARQATESATMTPRLSPDLSPRLAPDLAGGHVAKTVGAMMGAMVERLGTAATPAAPTLEQALRTLGEANRRSEQRLAAMDAADAARRRETERGTETAPPRADLATPASQAPQTAPSVRAPDTGATRRTATGQGRPPSPDQTPSKTSSVTQAAKAPPARAAESPQGDARTRAAPEGSPVSATRTRTPERSPPVLPGDQGTAGDEAPPPPTAKPTPQVAPAQPDMFAPTAGTGERSAATGPEAKEADASETKAEATRRARRKAIMSRRGKGGPSR